MESMNENWYNTARKLLIKHDSTTLPLRIITDDFHHIQMLIQTPHRVKKRSPRIAVAPAHVVPQKAPLDFAGTHEQRNLHRYVL